MVQLQLCTLEHLMNSGFGRPFPRHGLQLLFWFANHCVTCELMNCVVIMKLVSDCQPERGLYGFHLFGNVEELLPALNRPRRGKRQVMYFEVGNLSTETYPSSANLPTYVRENYEFDGTHGNSNIDRIIISYQVQSRVVEAVYVTEHDAVVFGRFNPDRTYEINSEVIVALQDPQLDLTTFLSQMGYYGDIQEVQAADTDLQLSDQEMLNTVQTFYSGATQIGTWSVDEDLRFFSEAFNQQLYVNTEPFCYDKQVHYTVSQHNNGSAVNNIKEVRKYRRPKSKKRQRAIRANYWLPEWEESYGDFVQEFKKRDGDDGIGLVRILLAAGALYLAVKCFSWLRSCWKTDLSETVPKMIPWMTPNFQQTHVMLDYVY
ncbi:uncharacterized protein ACBR49_000396 isoform 1-T2 [Aulostomus maculatus]